MYVYFSFKWFLFIWLIKNVQNVYSTEKKIFFFQVHLISNFWFSYWSIMFGVNHHPLSPPGNSGHIGFWKPGIFIPYKMELLKKKIMIFAALFKTTIEVTWYLWVGWISSFQHCSLAAVHTYSHQHCEISSRIRLLTPLFR